MWPAVGVAAVAASVAAPAAGSSAEDPASGCWVRGDPLSRPLLCCGGRPGRSAAEEEREPPADCWTSGIARGSPAACCDSRRLAALDARTAAAAAAEGPSPCQDAGSLVWGFVESSAQRLLWEGRLFSQARPGQRGDEDWLLRDEDTTYEVCPAALLLAFLARISRSLVRRNVTEVDRWMEAYDSWNALRWTATLAWRNLQDPLVRPALQAASLELNVLRAIVLRPADICSKFITHMAFMLDQATGHSLTVSREGASNLEAYGTMAQSALVVARHGNLLQDTPGCEGARLLAHMLSARRFLDLRPQIGTWHAWSAGRLVIRHMNPSVSGELWARVLDLMDKGLQVHQHWIDKAKVEGGPPLPQLPPGMESLGPLSIWERGVAPTFSEGPKDPVLERLFALIGAGDRYYVEIGTQSGEQCNTRYLRVRYGFSGLMIDDNYQNQEVNQWRHRVTPDNVVELFHRYNVPQSFDLLSLDTDGNEWLLWLSLQQGNFSPRVVIIEYSPSLPFDQDLLVRYTDFPVHRLCLSSLQRMPELVGGSVAGILALGRSWGYHLVHLVGGGTTDLVFVRGDVLEEKGLTFPAQDDPAGLCSLARYQTNPPQEFCPSSWPPGRTPPSEIFATAADALGGDWKLPTHGWSPRRLQDVLC